MKKEKMTHNANIEMTQIIELANKILGAITERFKEQLQTHLKQTKKKRRSQQRQKIERQNHTAILEPKTQYLKQNLNIGPEEEKDGEQINELEDITTEIAQSEQWRENTLENK